jgi:hypothetical protein
MCLPSIVHPKGSESEVNATRMSEKEAVKKEEEKEEEESNGINLKSSTQALVSFKSSNIECHLIVDALRHCQIHSAPGAGSRASGSSS